MSENMHFKTQAGPVVKNATPRSPAGNRTPNPGSLPTELQKLNCHELGCEFCILIQVVIPMQYKGIKFTLLAYFK